MDLSLLDDFCECRCFKERASDYALDAVVNHLYIHICNQPHTHTESIR